MKQAREKQRTSQILNETAEADEIRFYRADEKPYGAFSNLFKRPVLFEGVDYPTSEHAYQAGKPRKQAVREWILSAPAPSLVAMAAHGLYPWDIVSDWAEIKYDRMREVLRAKFSQHDDLRDLLLSTGDARIIETARVNNTVNRNWGEVNGKGRNMMGVLLMEIRTELRNDQTSTEKPRRKKSASPADRMASDTRGSKKSGARTKATTAKKSRGVRQGPSARAKSRGHDLDAL